MKTVQEIKEGIIRKYEDDAKVIDTPEWISLHNNVRVPEPGAAHYFVDRKIKMALKLCGDHFSKNADVLEVGCSYGHMTAILAKLLTRLSAMDISPRSVNLAEKRLRSYGITNVNFSVDDAESLTTYSDNSFDIVFSFSTIRFCPQPDKALLSIRKKLRPGGIAVIDFPNIRSPWHTFFKPLLGIKPHIHDKLYTREQALSLFEKTGFQVDEVKSFLFTSRKLPAFLLPFFVVIDYIFERLPLLPRYAGIIMIRGTKK